MYVCLCKALTESDVAMRARSCIQQGPCTPEDFLEVLDLHGDEVCGFCAEHPQDLLGIFEDEMELHYGYSVPPNEPATKA